MNPENINEAIAKVIVGNIHIPLERYGELMKAEREARTLKALIRKKAKKHDSVSYTEVQFLAELFDLEETSEELEDDIYDFGEEEENG